MAKNTVPIIIGAVVFGLLAIGLTIFSVFRGAAPAPVETSNTVAVQPAAVKHYIAVRPIYPRTVITSDMLRESDEGEGVESTAVTNLTDIVGKMANRTIQRDQVITADTLTMPIARVIPANIPIPLGLRAVAVWVDPAQTAAGLVDVGDRVDVIATHELTLEKQGSQVVVGATAFTSGRTIAQDLEVLAVDKSITEVRPVTPPATAGQAEQPGANGAAAPGAAPAPTPTPAPTPVNQPGQEQRTRIILAAAPNVAQRLVAANSKGELHITIRNPNSRENSAQPEAREYPSRIAAGPRVSGAGQMSERQARMEEAKLGADIIKSIAGGRNDQSILAPAPIPSPNMNGGTPGLYTPQPAPEKEVTVIRGTEKTRVVVPR